MPFPKPGDSGAWFGRWRPLTGVCLIGTTILGRQAGTGEGCSQLGVGLDHHRGTASEAQAAPSLSWGHTEPPGGREREQGSREGS